MNPIVQGLQVSVLGLLITFLALGVFIFVMVGLQRLFPEKEQLPEEMPAEEPVLIVVETADKSEEGAVVAAISAALHAMHIAQRSQLGDSLAQGKGGWWSARRAEARQGRPERRGQEKKA